MEKCTRDGYAYKPCYCPGRIYIELNPWHFGIFAIFFCQIQVKTKKKSYHLSAGPLALCHMLNPSLVIALRLQNGKMKA